MKPRDADLFVKSPESGVIGVLLYGPNEGLAADRSQILCRSVLGSTAQGGITELPQSALLDDTARLHDELTSLSLLAEKRVIRVRDTTDLLSAQLEQLVGKALQTDNFLVIMAGNLGPASKIRKLFETAPHLAALACYDMDEKEIARRAKDILRTAGISVEQDGFILLTDLLSQDWGMAKQELEKLIVYAGKSKSLTEDDIARAIGDGSHFDLSAAAWAVGDGNFSELDRCLDRLFLDGESPIGILRACSRHFSRLFEVVTSGEPLSPAMDKLKPPVFWKEKEAFQRQARSWRKEDLRTALETLTKTEILCKTSGLRDQTQCRQMLLSLARLAARGRKNER